MRRVDLTEKFNKGWPVPSQYKISFQLMLCVILQNPWVKGITGLIQRHYGSNGTNQCWGHLLGALITASSNWGEQMAPQRVLSWLVLWAEASEVWQHAVNPILNALMTHDILTITLWGNYSSSCFIDEKWGLE